MIPYLRCEQCKRATITTDEGVRPREVCWCVERNQNLCFWCYQGAQRQAVEQLQMGREYGDVGSVA